METNELLDRVHEGNEEAFRMLFALHGEALYQSLFARCRDKRLAREVLKDVFQRARATLRNSAQPDGTALWLNEIAMNGLDERLVAERQSVAALDELPCERENAAAETCDQESGEAERILCDVRRGMHTIPEHQNKSHIATTVIAIILIVLLLLTIWYIVGTLMRMGKLPYVDLGYKWFSSHVLALF